VDLYEPDFEPYDPLLDDELWSPIFGFLDYSVSYSGLIRNDNTGRLMSLSKTKQGAVKVNLTQGGRATTRSVKVLVAEAFVPGQTDIFDTPINLDGVQENNHADNLMWRPRWFAWRYAHQFENVYDYYRANPVIDVHAKVLYEDMYDAATTNGLLLKDILLSCHNNDPVFPTWQRFEVYE